MPNDLIANARFFSPINVDEPLVDGIVNELAEKLRLGGKQKQRLVLIPYA